MKDKRGSLIVSILLIILVLALLAIIGYSVYKYETSTKVLEKGFVFKSYSWIKGKALNPVFGFLFGKDFEKSMNWLIGGEKGVGNFFYNLFVGIVATLILVVVSLFASLTDALFHWKTYWLRTIAGTKTKAMRYLGLIIIYPTLMQIKILNRFIEIITFYHLTGFWIKALVLAIYVGFLPDIIFAIIRYREYAKAQKAIFKTKAGAEIMRAAAPT